LDVISQWIVNCNCNYDYSFIHSGYLYRTPSRNLLGGALSPAKAKEKCLEKLAERRYIVLGQEAQCKEFIPSGEASFVPSVASYF